ERRHAVVSPRAAVERHRDQVRSLSALGAARVRGRAVLRKSADRAALSADLAGVAPARRARADADHRAQAGGCRAGDVLVPARRARPPRPPGAGWTPPPSRSLSPV